LAALIAPCTASGASGGASAIPVRRIAVDSPPPTGTWAKSLPVAAPCSFGWAPLVPAEAGGIEDGSPATGLGAGGGAGAARFDSASTRARAFCIAIVSPSALSALPAPAAVARPFSTLRPSVSIAPGPAAAAGAGAQSGAASRQGSSAIANPARRGIRRAPRSSRLRRVERSAIYDSGKIRVRVRWPT